jgi:SynChlorMet cassette radical SAM/SPASM protein ScmF
LLHPQIARILDLVSDRRLGLAIETNGVLMTPELVRRIAGFAAAFVSVSLDGVDAATHDRVRGVPGTFAKATGAIALLAAAGIRPEIIMTVMRENVAQIDAMVALAEGLGAGAVKFNIVQPMARGTKLHRSGAGLEIAELIRLCRRIDGELAAGTKLSLRPHIPPAFLSLRHTADHTVGRCGIFNILGLLPNGDYALCGAGETIPDLVFGHAGRDPLADVWAHNPVLKRLRRELPAGLHGICGRCVMKAQCLGTCVAQNLYRDSDLLASFWFCAEADRLGLFPPSRIMKDVVGGTDEEKHVAAAAVVSA